MNKPRKVLGEQKHKEIAKEYYTTQASYNDLCKKHDVSFSTIANIIKKYRKEYEKK